MTAVTRERAPGMRTSPVKTLIVALAIGIGVGVGLGLVQPLDLGREGATASFEGSMVERSLAMQANINALIEGGNAQLAAVTAAPAFHGPIVERSLAMERNHAALIAGGLAQSKYRD